MSERGIRHNTHPGEILSESILKHYGLTIVKASQLLGVTRPNLSNIINGKSGISPKMAIRISRVFGGTPNIWVRLQSAYDLQKAEQYFENENIHLEKFETV